MAHLPDLGKIAAGEHGFETNNGEGRLILRSIQPEEIQIYHTIRSDPQNNQFNAYPDYEIGVDKLEQVLTPKWRHDVPIFQLFVILKAKKGYWPQKLVIKEGTVVGVVEVNMAASKNANHHRTALVGIVIHHLFANERYGKEALIAVLDYAFLSKAGLEHGTHATGLKLDEVVLDTESQNVNFVSRMASLGLGELQKKSTREDKGHPQVKYLIWTVEKAFWEVKRGNVQMGWMPSHRRKLPPGGTTSVKTLHQGPEHQYSKPSGSHSGHQTEYQLPKEGHHQGQN
jgi:RimJ/RimL family protein N-acetyltransferase